LVLTARCVACIRYAEALAEAPLATGKYFLYARQKDLPIRFAFRWVGGWVSSWGGLRRAARHAYRDVTMAPTPHSVLTSNSCSPSILSSTPSTPFDVVKKLTFPGRRW
jgi:hypothetical protein